MSAGSAAEFTVVAGIPIPSTSPVFLSVLTVHVGAGLICVVAGALAMLSAKRPGRHPLVGTIYVCGLAVVFGSMAILSAMRWSQDRELFALGAAAFGSAVVGRAAARARRTGWPPAHIVGMGLSYVLLLTAFYVDNGRNLPLWRSLPVAAYWLGPILIGGPLVVLAMTRHAVVRAERSARRL